MPGCRRRWAPCPNGARDVRPRRPREDGLSRSRVTAYALALPSVSRSPETAVALGIAESTVKAHRQFVCENRHRLPCRSGQDRCRICDSAGRLEHDPEKHALGLGPRVGTGFPKKIMLKQKDRAG